MKRTIFGLFVVVIIVSHIAGCAGGSKKSYIHFPQNASLQINATPDITTYRPGETMTVKVELKNISTKSIRLIKPDFKLHRMHLTWPYDKGFICACEVPEEDSFAKQNGTIKNTILLKPGESLKDELKWAFTPNDYWVKKYGKRKFRVSYFIGDKYGKGIRGFWKGCTDSAEVTIEIEGEKKS